MKVKKASVALSIVVGVILTVVVIALIVMNTAISGSSPSPLILENGKAFDSPLSNSESSSHFLTPSDCVVTIQSDPEVQQECSKVKEKLESQGFTVRQVPDFPNQNTLVVYKDESCEKLSAEIFEYLGVGHLSRVIY